MTNERTFTLLAVLSVVCPFSQVNAAKPTDYQLVGLEWHNKFRAHHNSPPLTLDDALNKEAEAHADDFAKRKTTDLKWWRSGSFENMYTVPAGLYFESLGLKKYVEMAVKEWYNKISHYDFNKGETNWHSAMFVQTVCAQGKKLGIGAKTLGGFSVVVAIYEPKGCKSKDETLKNVQWPKSNVSLAHMVIPVVKPTDYQLLGLMEHNRFRAWHNSPPLALDDDLTKEAEARVNDFVKRKTVDQKWYRHGVDENVYKSTYSPYLASFDLKRHVEHAVKWWYNGVEGYDFEEGRPKGHASCFVRLMCTKSKKLGISARTLDNFTAVVALYAPKACFDQADVFKYVPRPKTGVSLGYTVVTVAKPTDYQLMGLNEHNRYRALHNSPPLVLDAELIKEADASAADYARRNKPDHKWWRQGLGENLCAIKSNGPVEQQVKTCIASFYKEISQWNFDKTTPEQQPYPAGHFVQMICTKCKKLGVGAQQNDGVWVIVITYEPQGCHPSYGKDFLKKAVPRPKTGNYSKTN